MEITSGIENKYQLFIEQAAAAEPVWGLKDKRGFANSTSAEDEDVSVVPFWSDKASAKACARDDWKGFLPISVSIAEFLESWCMEMFENGMLVGVNWDANMNGKEATAISLALAILNQLKVNNSGVKFANYDSTDQFIEEINDLIGGDE